MPQQRIDIRMIKDVLRLKYQGGLSHERIANSDLLSRLPQELQMQIRCELDLHSTSGFSCTSQRTVAQPPSLRISPGAPQT